MNKNRKKHTLPISKPVPTLNLVDYSEMKMPVVVVYDSPWIFREKSLQEYGRHQSTDQRMCIVSMKQSLNARKMQCQPDSL